MGQKKYSGFCHQVVIFHLTTARIPFIHHLDLFPFTKPFSPSNQPAFVIIGRYLVTLKNSLSLCMSLCFIWLDAKF